MEIILIVATLLGGAAALWFFWDKITGWRQRGSAHISTKPTYADIQKAILRSDPQTDWKRSGDRSRTITSYKHDPNLRFEILLTDEGVHCENFQEPWATRYPDPLATSYYCKLYYSSTLLESFILVSVDGGRALLPLPDARTPESNGIYRVSPLRYKVAQIHDIHGTLDEYMKRSGMSTW